MRILIATNNCHLPQQFGGSEVSAHELAQAMLSRGVEVAVMSALNGKVASLYYWNRLKSRVTGCSFPSDRYCGYRVYRGWSRDGDVIYGLDEVLSNFRPDLVLCQGARVMKMVQACQARDVAVAAMVVDVEFHDLGGVPEPGSRVRYRCNSNFTAEKFFQSFGIVPDVVYPYVRRENYLVETRREYIAFVNPHPFKGVDIVLELARRNPDLRFVMQESWPIGQEYKAGLLEKIAGIPNLSYREPVLDMKGFYSGAKVLLAPSQYEEAWGRVVNEAQINGIPVIASDRGGLPEAVGAGGVIVAHDAPVEVWESALRNLVDNEDRYKEFVGKALSRTRSGELSEGVLIDDYQNFFRNVVSQYRSEKSFH